jgi:arginine repressor
MIEMNYKTISKNIEVIKLLKKRKEIEDKIYKLDANALINYELKLLSSPSINDSFSETFEVSKEINELSNS